MVAVVCRSAAGTESLQLQTAGVQLPGGVFTHYTLHNLCRTINHPSYRDTAGCRRSPCIATLLAWHTQFQVLFKIYMNMYLLI